MVSEAVVAANGEVDPVVAAPRGAVDPAVAALTTVDRACRILVPSEALDKTGWGTCGRLRDMIDRGDSRLRCAEIDTPAVVGECVQAVGVRSGLGTASWVDHDPSESDVRETLEQVWERGDPVDLDCPSTTDVCRAVDRLADGESGRLRDLTAPARDRDLDLTAAVVWSAAGGKPRRDTLVDTVADATGVSETTVSRRIRRLNDSGILTSERDITATDGRGPPPTRVVRDVEPPLSRLQQEALQ